MCGAKGGDVEKAGLHELESNNPAEMVQKIHNKFNGFCEINALLKSCDFAEASQREMFAKNSAMCFIILSSRNCQPDFLATVPVVFI